MSLRLGADVRAPQLASQAAPPLPRLRVVNPRSPLSYKVADVLQGERGWRAWPHRTRGIGGSVWRRHSEISRQEAPQQGKSSFFSLRIPQMLRNGPAASLFAIVLLLALLRYPSLQSLFLCLQIAFCAALGAHLADTTAVGRAASSLVSAMAVSVVLAQYIKAPPVTLRYLQRCGIALATPLLLLNCDLEAAVGVGSRRLLRAFGVVAAGVLVGSLIATRLLMVDLLRICRSRTAAAGIVGALAGKNIGTGMNFIAVSEVLKVPADVFGLALVADNLLGLLYFPLVSALIPEAEQKSEPQGASEGASDGAAANSNVSRRQAWQRAAGAATAAACIACSLRSVLPSGEALIASSLFTVAATTVLSSRWKQWPLWAAAGTGLATPLVHIYSGTVGFSIGRITWDMALGCVPLIWLNLIIYAVHLTFAFVGERFLGFKREEVMVASSASIGGPGIASAVALSKGYTTLAQRAVLIGSVGNAVGTLLGIALSRVLLFRIL